VQPMDLWLDLSHRQPGPCPGCWPLASGARLHGRASTWRTRQVQRDAVQPADDARPQALLQLFDRRGGSAVQDNFSTSHFALAHVPDTEDPAWQVRHAPPWPTRDADPFLLRPALVEGLRWPVAEARPAAPPVRSPMPHSRRDGRCAWRGRMGMPAPARGKAACSVLQAGRPLLCCARKQVLLPCCAALASRYCSQQSLCSPPKQQKLAGPPTAKAPDCLLSSVCLQECMHVVRAERDMAARVRACVARAASSPLLPLACVDWGAGGGAIELLRGGVEGAQVGHCRSQGLRAQSV